MCRINQLMRIVKIGSFQNLITVEDFYRLYKKKKPPFRRSLLLNSPSLLFNTFPK